MLSKLNDFFSAFLADTGHFHKLGFRAQSFNGDLFVVKKLEHLEIRFYQGFEPFHPQFSKIVDFDIPDGLFLLVYNDAVEAREIYSRLVEQLNHSFENIVIRECYIFIYDQHLDFGSSALEIKLNKLIGFLSY